MVNMKNALENITTGTLKDVIDRIQQEQLKLTSNNALKLLVCCCTVCSKNGCKIPVKDVCLLVTLCSSKITELNEVQLTNYLQSIYHILKYLIVKVSFRQDSCTTK